MHRLSYSLTYGGIPVVDGKSLNVDHIPDVCEKLACFNPRHLEAITGRERARRIYANKNHCSAGHEYTPESLLKRKDGHRDCRICANGSRRSRRRVPAAGKEKTP